MTQIFSVVHSDIRGLNEETTHEIKLTINVVFRDYMALFKGAKLAVFLSIALRMNRYGWSTPPMPTIMHDTGLSDRNTISKSITELEEMRIEGQRILIVLQQRQRNGQFVQNEYLVFPTKKEVLAYELGELVNPTRKSPSREKPYTAQRSPRRGLRYTANQTVSNTDSSDDLESEQDSDTKLSAQSAEPPVSKFVELLRTEGLDMSVRDGRDLVSEVIAWHGYGLHKGTDWTSIAGANVIKSVIDGKPTVQELAVLIVDLWDMYVWHETAVTKKNMSKPIKPSAIVGNLRDYHERPQAQQPTETPVARKKIEYGVLADGTRRPLTPDDLPSQFVETYFDYAESDS